MWPRPWGYLPESGPKPARTSPPSQSQLRPRPTPRRNSASGLSGCGLLRSLLDPPTKRTSERERERASVRNIHGDLYGIWTAFHTSVKKKKDPWTHHIFVVVTVIVRFAGVWIAVTHQIFQCTTERAGHWGNKQGFKFRRRFIESFVEAGLEI